MKILQLVQKPQRRGAEVFAFHLTQELRRREQQVQVAYLYPYDGENGLPLEESDSVLQGEENSITEKFPGLNSSLFRRLQVLITRFKPDIVQANGARTIKYGALARRFSRNGSWVLIYRNIGNPEDWMSGAVKRFLYRRFLMSRVDGVVGVSEITLRRVLDFYGLTVPSIHIPRGIDTSSFVPVVSKEVVRQRIRTPMESKVILFAGSLTPEKRLDRFLRVVSKIKSKHRDIHAWVAGGGPMRLNMEGLAESMGLKEFVHFLGVETDIASVINGADILLLTSDTEGIPGVVLEAASLGVPAVATSVGGLSECIVDHRTGVLVNKEDEDKMAEAVLNLLTDPVQYGQMGDHARAFVTQNFDIKKIASRYLDFYRDVLRRQKHSV